MRRVGKINQAIFENAKKLLAMRIHQKKVADFLGVSLATISNIVKNDTWADFENFKKQNNEKNKEEKREVVPGKTTSPFDNAALFYRCFKEMSSRQIEIVGLLKRLVNKLDLVSK